MTVQFTQQNYGRNQQLAFGTSNRNKITPSFGSVYINMDKDCWSEGETGDSLSSKQVVSEYQKATEKN
ncbi:MAG: hypothetical protein A2287_09890 [Candidatus Melainabacteria bacterium RIFOXYA12_FULL_32_12]|nr:MAG: hypothetical protein A2287_09890 [Candidatus Melainabacteria bacterium RIFOXYA12_FULL_32_12]